MNFLTQNDSGSGLPYINWSSDAVQWNKKQGDNTVQFQFTNAIFDMQALKIGWIKYKPIYDAILEDYYKEDGTTNQGVTRPSEMIQKNDKQVPAYNKGFSVNVLFGKDFGDERLFSFTSAQKGSSLAVGELLTQYEQEKAANPNKVPVVTFSGHTNKKFGMGSTNVPNLKITSWVDRPTELDAEPNTVTANNNTPALVPAPPAQASGASEF